MNRIKISIICLSLFTIIGCNKNEDYKIIGLQNPQAISVMVDRVVVATELSISNTTNRPMTIDSLALEAFINDKPAGVLNKVPPKLRETLQQTDIPLMIVFPPQEIYGKNESELLSDFFRTQGIPTMTHYKGSIFVKDNKGEVTELKVNNQINVNVTKVK